MRVQTIAFTLILIVNFSVQVSFGQHIHNAWFKAKIDIPINNRLTIDTEVQHRRQSNLNTADFIGKNLMYSYRNWLHYQHSPHLKFSLSPFSYFYNYSIIQEPIYSNKKPIEFFRFSGALKLKYPLFEKLDIINRTAIEHQLHLNNKRNVTRFRNRIGITHQLYSNFNIGIHNEFILNIQETLHTNFFNQHRLILNFAFNLTTSFKIDLGYIHLIRQLPNDNRLIYEHNLYLNLSYKLTKFQS